MAAAAATLFLASFTFIAVIGAPNSICSTEKIGDTVKSQTNFRLQLSSQNIDKKVCYVEIPHLPYCQLSGAVLTVCDSVAAPAPQLLMLNLTAAIVIRNSDLQPASQQLILYCRFDE